MLILTPGCTRVVFDKRLQAYWRSSVKICIMIGCNPAMAAPAEAQPFSAENHLASLSAIAIVLF
jgi:hypothetical protein